jgi:hypothetical protein
MTARWYKPVTSVERSGKVNITTHKFGIRLKFWAFLPFVLWGNIVNVFTGYYFDHYNLLEDTGNLYDKLAHRAIPAGRVWARPG